jgi:probable rRNA maturation factor
VSTRPSAIEARVSDRRWTEALKKKPATLAAKAVAAAMKTVRKPGAVEILFTDDAEMRRLNRQWRKLDQPTDVLSFPSSGPKVPGQPRRLGDIALGFETALRDAKAMNRAFEAHVSHLVIHGFLHLVGYDHIKREDAAVMEPLETKILAGLGWPDPYATGPYAGERRKG